jgi:hypothetical protein
MTGPRIGALIAATAGLVFTLVNAGALADQPALVVRVLGGLAGAGVIVLVLTRPEPAVPVPAPSGQAWRVYWSMVTLEAVLLIVGTRLLVAQDHTELTVPWVAVVVGVHFLPFASAFGAALFRWLGWALISLGTIGAVLGVTAGTGAGELVAGVLSGVVLLGFAMRFQ